MEFRKAARLAVEQAVTADVVTTLGELADTAIAMAFPHVREDDVLMGLTIAAKSLVRTAIRLAPKTVVNGKILLPLIAVKVGHDDYRYVPATQMDRPAFRLAVDERDKAIDATEGAKFDMTSAASLRSVA